MTSRPALALLRGMPSANWKTLQRILVEDPVPLGRLVLVTVVPALAAGYALLHSGRVLSREMTWDLLFNLAGAWNLVWGQVAHVDFHEPVGILNFWLTAIGFQLVGYTPFAFVVGSALMAALLFAAAVLAAWRRLALLPAAVFVVLIVLLALVPTSLGDFPRAYSFAMSYNRYGWAGLTILFLVLFMPPRPSRFGGLVDLAVASVLVAAMFYLKITYFLAALGTIGVAALVWPHLRAVWRRWALLVALALAIALSPVHHAYLVDLRDAAVVGGIRSSASLHLNTLFAYMGEYSGYGALFVVAVWLARARLIGPRLPFAIFLIVGVSFVVVSQNNQVHDLPGLLAIAFLCCGEIARRWPQQWLLKPLLPVVALLVFPLFTISTYSVSVAGYARKVRQDPLLQVVESTQLRGLVVPSEPGNLLGTFSTRAGDYHLLGIVRSVGARFEITPFEYVQTLMEAASLFAEGEIAPRTGIALLDQVNVIPFMMGIRPPRGGNLWSGWDVPVRPAAEIFAEADHVLIPKFSTSSRWTDAAVEIYDAYLTQHFPYERQSESWIVKSRRPRP